MFTCLYTCYLVAKTFIHASSVRKIIISMHFSLQLPKIAYGGENTRLYSTFAFFHKLTYRSDSSLSVDFCVRWLKRRGLAQGCAFWELKKIEINI